VAEPVGPRHAIQPGGLADPADDQPDRLGVSAGLASRLASRGVAAPATG
jgi:hypothetical protein